MRHSVDAMRRLTIQICEYMSAKAAQEGIVVSPEALYRPVDRYLSDVEAVLHRDVIESISHIDWAILMPHARQNEVSPRDVVMEILCGGMENSVKVAAMLRRKKAAQATRHASNKRPKPNLRLVK